jgi:HipA-like protein
MRKFSKKVRDWLTDAREEWGRLPPIRPPAVSARRELRLVLDTQTGEKSALLVGVLVVAPEAFEFSYSEEFRESKLPTIPSFPDREKIYRSDTLFPFFQVRIPPISRRDVARVLKERSIGDDDIYEQLKVLGERTAASPYRCLAAS